MNQIKNILFDLGNVILNIDIPLAIDNIADLLKRPDQFEPVMKAIMAYETGAIQTELFINRIIRDARPAVQALDVIEAWNSMLIGIPEHRLEMLGELNKDYNLYILSNTNPLHISWMHNHLETSHQISDFEDRFFKKVFYSHIVRDRKPNVSIYEKVITDAGLNASETLFLDDMEDNLESARALGFQTEWVDPEVDVRENLTARNILK